MREALSCDLSKALYYSGIVGHYGDSYIGATHNKKGSSIFTEYLYENVEGLRKDGLWIVADTICVGRNLEKTLESLLSKNKPDELIIISPYASREGINYIDDIIVKFHVPVTYFAWGALFGVDEKTRYDMPWGHQLTEALDKRDKETFISMYCKELCVGGDFGNNYYSPHLSLELYAEQLKKCNIKANIPSIDAILKKYKKEEFVIR